MSFAARWPISSSVTCASTCKGRSGSAGTRATGTWAPDYDSRLSEADRTRDYSEDIESRNRLLEQPGDEAQWCIFDPLISAFHGRRFLATGAPADLAAQVLHFNRSIAQITPDWRCPELYFKQRGRFVANPHVPLLWTQANLQLALIALQASAGRR